MQQERRLRAWSRDARFAENRLRRALQEVVARVERLQWEVGSVPICLSTLDNVMEPILARLVSFGDACLDDADYCARAHVRIEHDFANLRPSSDAEPEPTPTPAGSSSGP